jgi:hypothetical protein
MRSFLGRSTVAAVCAALAWSAGSAAAQETPAAKATRKKLDMKISVEFKDTRLKDAFDDIKREFDNRLGVKIDNPSGVSNNSKVTYKADEQTLKKILDELCTKYEMGWFVLSKPGDRYDGFIVIKKGTERGYEKGKEPKDEPKDNSSLGPRRRDLAAEPARLTVAVTALSGKRE